MASRLAAVGVLCGLSVHAASLRAEEIRPAFPKLEQGDDVRETYTLNTMGIVHEEVSSPFAFVFGGVWWRPVRGKYRNAVSYRNFYEALGRPDLADSQASKHFWCQVMIWGGLGAEVGGAVLFFTGLSGGHFSTQAKIGLGVFGGGLVSSAIGALTDKPVLSEDEAVAASQAYNEALREHLGAPEPSAALGRRPRVVFTPVVGQRLAGFSVRASF
jgi:hypothetical protein